MDDEENGDDIEMGRMDPILRATTASTATSTVASTATTAPTATTVPTVTTLSTATATPTATTVTTVTTVSTATATPTATTVPTVTTVFKATATPTATTVPTVTTVSTATATPTAASTDVVAASAPTTVSSGNLDYNKYLMQLCSSDDTVVTFQIYLYQNDMILIKFEMFVSTFIIIIDEAGQIKVHVDIHEEDIHEEEEDLFEDSKDDLIPLEKSTSDSSTVEMEEAKTRDPYLLRSRKN
ncbi:uncharacterized protein [Argopecten irradians]|uniref:uncharacterized protein isoform X2 n=1 Tax=Argopecten irradians TaxID=31199 RepID=UPI0037200DFB